MIFRRSRAPQDGRKGRGREYASHSAFSKLGVGSRRHTEHPREVLKLSNLRASTETLRRCRGRDHSVRLYYDGVAWQESELIARNVPNDNGLGVCSINEPCTADGNYNELSQLEDNEAILLEKPAGSTWEGLWLSSLDNNGGDSSLGPENGILYWGNTNVIAELIKPVNSFPFTFDAFGGGAVEGELLGSGFDPTARYMLFLPGGALYDNNDYLVWGADLGRTPGDEVPVPEPASLLLLGSGLLAIAHKRRRASQP